MSAQEGNMGTVKKKMPMIDAVFNAGAHRGFDAYSSLSIELDADNTLEGAEHIARMEDKLKTPHDVARFRRGWYTGVANYAIWRIQSLQRYLKREDLAAMSDELRALHDKYEALFTAKDASA